MRPPDRPRYAHGHRPNRPNPSGRHARKNPGSATAVRRPPPVPVGTAALRCAGPAANLTGFVFDCRLQFYERSPSWTRSTFWNQSSIYFLPFLFVCLRVCAWTYMISLSFIACCSCCSCCCCSCSCCSCSCSCCSCSCSCSCCSCCSCAAPALSTCANIQSVLNHCCSSRPLPFMPPGIQCLRRALIRRFRRSARTAPAALCRHVARHAHLVLAVAQVGVLGLACVVETVVR